MLIPVLHYEGNCADAIALYEKAFNTKAKDFDYSEDNKIRHSEMVIHEQTVYLNDGKNFISDMYSINCAAHLTLTFKTPEELLNCYENLKEGGKLPTPFVETHYSKLVGNFIDRFGVLWGFMVVD